VQYSGRLRGIIGFRDDRMINITGTTSQRRQAIRARRRYHPERGRSPAQTLFRVLPSRPDEVRHLLVIFFAWNTLWLPVAQCKWTIEPAGQGSCWIVSAIARLFPLFHLHNVTKHAGSQTFAPEPRKRPAAFTAPWKEPSDHIDPCACLQHRED